MKSNNCIYLIQRLIVATSPDGPHTLLVPVDKKVRFETALAKLPANERVKWIRHTIRSGDSVGQLAVQYNTTKALIRQSNHVKNDKIVIGKTLMIPTAAGRQQLYALSYDQRLQNKQNRQINKSIKTNYVVKEGDSFWLIANKHQVSVEKLARWNNLSPKDTLRIGQRLSIWQAHDQQGKTRKVIYQVKSGDNLHQLLIDSKYPSDIKKGMKLENTFSLNEVNLIRSGHQQLKQKRPRCRPFLLITVSNHLNQNDLMSLKLLFSTFSNTLAERAVNFSIGDFFTLYFTVHTAFC